MIDPPIIKTITTPPVNEMDGDNTPRRFRFWGPVQDTEDVVGELTPPDSMTKFMDWFVDTHGGPLTVNHSHRVIGNATGWGMGRNPRNGMTSVWLDGLIHRGPAGTPFPAADRVWRDIREGRAKGSSWAGDILKEVKEMDMNTFTETVTNSEVLPYSWGIVTDFNDEQPIPALKESIIETFNDKAKAEDTTYFEILEEPKMADEPNKEDPVPEKTKTEDQVKEEQPQYATVADLEKLKTDLMGMLKPPEPTITTEPEKVKQVDKEGDEPNEHEKPQTKKEGEEEEDDEDEKKKSVEDGLTELVEKAGEKMKALKAMIDTVGTPAPVIMEKEKTEKAKAIDLNVYNKLPIDQRLKMQEE